MKSRKKERERTKSTKQQNFKGEKKKLFSNKYTYITIFIYFCKQNIL